MYDPVGVLLEVFFEIEPFAGFSRLFGDVGHIEGGCVHVWGVGDGACVSCWLLMGFGWSERTSAREVEGGVRFVGVCELWVVVVWVLVQRSGNQCSSDLGV